MKTELILCSIAILLGVLFPSTTLAITSEDIVSGLEQREQSIKSIRGKFNVWGQYLMNDGNTVEFEKQYEWVKKDTIQKLTSEFKSIPERFKKVEPLSECEGCRSRIMTEKEIRTFDGKVTKQFLPDSNSASIFSGDQRFFILKGPADWLLMRVKQKPLPVFLRQEGVSLKYSGKVNLEGKMCHLLEITTPKTNKKLYLADEAGLVPVKYESYIINHTLPFNTRGEYIFSGFKHYGNITMPTKVIISVYDAYPDREQLSMKEIFTVKQLEVNVQIPEADLLIQFPPGTHVHDSVTGTDYIVR